MSVKLSKYKTKKKHNRYKKTKKKQHIHILNGGMKTPKQPKKIYKAPVVQHSRTHFSPGDEQETNPQAQQSQSPSQKKNKTRSYLGHVRKAFRKFIPPKLPNSKYIKKSNKKNSIKAKTGKKADKVNNNTTPLSNEDAQALLKKTLGGQNNEKNEGYEEGPEKPGKRNTKTANNGNGYEHKKTNPPPQTLTTEEKGTQSVLKETTRNEGYNEGHEKPGKRNKSAINGNGYEHKKPKPPPQTLTTKEKGTQSVLPKTITGSQSNIRNASKDRVASIVANSNPIHTRVSSSQMDNHSTRPPPVGPKSNLNNTPLPQTIKTKKQETQALIETNITVLPINKGVSIGTQSELQGKKPNIIISGSHAAPKIISNTNKNLQNSNTLLSPLYNPTKSVNEPGEYILLNNKSVPVYLDPSSRQDKYLDVNSTNYLKVSNPKPLYNVANLKSTPEYFDPPIYFNTSPPPLQEGPKLNIKNTPPPPLPPRTVVPQQKINNKPDYLDPSIKLNSVYDLPHHRHSKSQSDKGKSNPGYFTGKGTGNVDYAEASTIQEGSRKNTNNKKKNKSTKHLAFANLGYKTANGQGNTYYAKAVLQPSNTKGYYDPLSQKLEVGGVSNPIYERYKVAKTPVYDIARNHTSTTNEGNTKVAKPVSNPGYFTGTEKVDYAKAKEPLLKVNKTNLETQPKTKPVTVPNVVPNPGSSRYTPTTINYTEARKIVKSIENGKLQSKKVNTPGTAPKKLNQSVLSQFSAQTYTNPRKQSVVKNKKTTKKTPTQSTNHTQPNQHKSNTVLSVAERIQKLGFNPSNTNIRQINPNKANILTAPHTPVSPTEQNIQSRMLKNKEKT